MHNKTCIIIQGPTATGKTTLSLQLAEYFKTEIISADSRQCYREMEIGVAKPESSDLNKVKHYFINSHSIHDELNAGTFESYALDAVSKIFEENDTAIMVGGTGLYIKAFRDGIDEMPAINDEIRQEIRRQFLKDGIGWLYEMLRQHDNKFFNKGEMQNPQRMMRALEVKLSTGRSILDLHTQPKKQRRFSVINIGVELPRASIYHNINKRVDAMMQQGLLSEARALYPYRNLNALQTVGYTELFEFIEGKYSLPEAVSAIKKHTRHYAKRQLTWFRKDTSIHWFGPDDKEKIIALAEQQMQSHPHPET